MFDRAPDGSPQYLSEPIPDDNFAEIKVTSELNEYVGHEQIVTFNYQGQEILGKFSSSIEVESGKEITLYVDLNNICFFDQAQNSI